MQESGADTELAGAVVAKGTEISPRTVRRWRAADVLPATVHRGLGRGLGTEASYPGEALDVALGFAQAIEVAREKGRWMLLHRAVLIAFARGVEVGDRALSRAYRQMQRSVTETFRWALADGRVPSISFPGVKRPKGRPALDAPKYNDMVKAVMAVVVGQEHDPAKLRTFLVEAGCPVELFTDADLGALAENVQKVNVSGFAVTILAHGGRSRLNQTRDLLLAMRSDPLVRQALDQVVPSFAAGLDDDLQLALAVPAWLIPMKATTTT